MTFSWDEYEQLKQWAHLLGWDNLSVEEHRLAPEIAEAMGHNVIRSYESGTPGRILFQINELPAWQAAVYAIRYRICTGWHSFQFHDEGTRRNEAKRLHAILAAEWFIHPKKRKEYRRMHPEYCGYNWRRLREEGPPGLERPR